MPNHNQDTKKDDPLRVILASSQHGWHGGEEQARLLAEGLRRRGHDVHLLARCGETFAQRMADAGFSVTELSGGGRSLRGILQARKAIRQFRPDILHANDSHALACLLFASLGLKIPARIASRRVIYPIRTPAKFRCFADRIVCVANATLDTCRDAGLPEKRLALVFSGVDPARMEMDCGELVQQQEREKLGLAPDTLFLLCVGKLTEAKGHVDLLDAMPTVLQEYPDLVLGLAGDGELQSKLTLQAEQLGIAANVRFLGYRNDVPRLIQTADLYVQPSRSEGLCNVVIKAMFARRPVVVSARGGLLDLIPPADPNSEKLASDYGWLSPPENPTRLAASILEALDTPQEDKQHRVERAHQRALENFTADHMVDGMLRMYRDALSGN